jgi:hypothetical protein
MEGTIMDNKIIDQLQATYSEELDILAGDLGDLEEAVKTLMQQLGQGLLQRLVDQHANGRNGSSLACKCGNSMKFIQDRKKDIHTIFGWITVKRAYYHCPDCGESSFPYDDISGLGPEQISPGLAKSCCLLAVDDSFEQSSRKIEAITGQKVSDNTIERVASRVGSVAQQQQNQQLQRFIDIKQIPESQNKPGRLYVAVDGTTVHETDGWHECKVGTIYFEDDRNGRESRYVGRFDKSEDFGWHVWLAACKFGLRQAREVIYLGDGAPWIRTEHYRHFGRATFIIDWYHASEHIWDCGKELFGEGTKVTEQWVKRQLDLLRDGCTKKLLDDLKDQHKRYRSGKRKAIDALIRYISTNEEQMRYDVFRSKGYDIGSGSVEGACKNMVGKRLKQSGMIWTRLGSSSVLALRACWLNDEWEQLWRTKPLAA